MHTSTEALAAFAIPFRISLKLCGRHLHVDPHDQGPAEKIFGAGDRFPAVGHPPVRGSVKGFNKCQIYNIKTTFSAPKLNRDNIQDFVEGILRFFAAERSLAVSEELDLVEVAIQISNDNKVLIEQWMIESRR